MAVLDTDILIDLMRRRPTPASRRAGDLIQRLQDSGERLTTTRFNVAELYVGAELSADPAREAERIDRALSPFPVLEFDDAAARAYGRINASLRRRGRSPGEMDLLIASIAISQREPLLTRNERHFSGVPGVMLIPVA